MADDLGYGSVGCYGSNFVKTPNIDALAKNGIRFTDYHSPGSNCSPSRAGILTGRYQQRAGYEDLFFKEKWKKENGLQTKEITFAECLKKLGYKTALVGKWHQGLHPDLNPVNQGFDEFRGFLSGNVDYISHVSPFKEHDWYHNKKEVHEEGYLTDLITKHSLDYIERYKDEPFFLYIAHGAPHAPYQTRNDPAERYPDTRGIPEGMPAKNDKSLWPDRYVKMIEILDESIGRVVQKIEKLGLAENTFIFFCSDNGGAVKMMEHFPSNRPLKKGKGSLWEGGHRVPAIAFWKGKIKGGRTSRDTVHGLDLFPTMMEITSTSIPKGLKLDGISIALLLFEGRKIKERTLFWRFRSQKVARHGKWKLLMEQSKEKTKDTVFVPHLYDLNNDIGEQNNLAAKYPEIVKSLQANLDDWEKDVPKHVNQGKKIRLEEKKAMQEYGLNKAEIPKEYQHYRMTMEQKAKLTILFQKAYTPEIIAKIEDFELKMKKVKKRGQEWGTLNKELRAYLKPVVSEYKKGAKEILKDQWKENW